MILKANRIIRFREIETFPPPFNLLCCELKHKSSLQYFLCYDTIQSKHGVFSKEALNVLNPILNQLNLPEYEY